MRSLNRNNPELFEQHFGIMKSEIKCKVRSQIDWRIVNDIGLRSLGIYVLSND